MDGDEGEGRSSLGLPIAPASDLDAGRNFDQSLFGLRKINATRQEEAGDGLNVSAAQPAWGAERLADGPLGRRSAEAAGVSIFDLRTPHKLILIELGVAHAHL